jgi:hypothetical protein
VAPFSIRLDQAQLLRVRRRKEGACVSRIPRVAPLDAAEFAR